MLCVKNGCKGTTSKLFITNLTPFFLSLRDKIPIIR